MRLSELRREGEAFMEALSREHWRAAAGFTSEARLAEVYARFAHVTSGDALDVARAAFVESVEGSDERRSARALLEWQAEARASRSAAPVDERTIAWEASAMVRTLAGRNVPYARVAIEIAAETDRAERVALDDARARLVETELAPLKRERLERERDAVLALELAPTYLDSFTLVSGVDVRALGAACERLLADTEAMWLDVAPRVFKRRLGIALDEATRADVLALARAGEFDAAFPARTMRERLEGQARAMGLDPLAGGRIDVDLEERPGKHARAFCAPVRIPDEVHLVLRPHGGASDWRTLLHELGHALHFAHMRADLPFEARWLGDNAVTEGFAMLFDHLQLDRGWLLRYTELGRTRVDEWLREAAFAELQMLRRYAGKLRYELELHGGGVSWASAPDLYVETLRAATSVRYQRADAFVDVDPWLYAVRYLRAWQLQARFAETLRERFDEDWWRNPRAGPWMVEQLFGEGQRELAEEMAERASGLPLSFAPVVRAVEARLA